MGDFIKLQRNGDDCWEWQSPIIYFPDVARDDADGERVSMQVRFALVSASPDRRYVTDVIEVATNSIYRALRLSGFNNPMILDVIKQNCRALFENWFELTSNSSSNPLLRINLHGTVKELPLDDYVPEKLTQMAQVYCKTLSLRNSSLRGRVWYSPGKEIIGVLHHREEDRGAIIEIHYTPSPRRSASEKFAIVTAVRHLIWLASWLAQRRSQHEEASIHIETSLPYEHLMTGQVTLNKRYEITNF
jgi:hypothetical protein